MDEKEIYTLRELFEDLPVTLAELGRRSEINEVTLARIRDGRKARRDTANRLLREMSEIYGKVLNLRNVTGINVQINRRLEAKQREESVA